MKEERLVWKKQEEGRWGRGDKGGRREGRKGR